MHPPYFAVFRRSFVIAPYSFFLAGAVPIAVKRYRLPPLRTLKTPIVPRMRAPRTAGTTDTTFPANKAQDRPGQNNDRQQDKQIDKGNGYRISDIHKDHPVSHFVGKIKHA